MVRSIALEEESWLRYLRSGLDRLLILKESVSVKVKRDRVGGIRRKYRGER
jgi:hypothetical protein